MAKYSDINLSFLPHPITGDISVLTDSKAISQSMKNLIFMDAYDVPFNPNIGGNIRATLFRPVDAITMMDITSRIQVLLENYEPRVIVNDVLVRGEPNNNKIKITIDYTIKTSSETIVFNFYIDRIV